LFHPTGSSPIQKYQNKKKKKKKEMIGLHRKKKQKFEE